MSAFRSDVECLRADNARLTARVAELESPPKRAKPKTRWGVPDMNIRDSMCSIAFAVGVVLLVIYAGVAAILFVGWAHIPMTDGIEQRGGIVFAILALAWCLAFVRRVPR